MNIVLDTSVLVAAMRSNTGASFAVLNLVPSTTFTFALTVTLYTEWQAVLTRAENIPEGLDSDDMLGFLRYLASKASLHDVHYLWRPMLRDPNDDMVLECAVTAQAEHIVTHNIRDFRGAEKFGVTAMTPSEFLKKIRSTS